MRGVRLVAMALLLVGTGCVDSFLEPEPDQDPLTIFDLVWQGFDRHYSFFDQKGVDWAEARERYGARVTEETTDRELFEILTEMTLELRDGHVGLVTPFGVSGYKGWREGRPESYDPLRVMGYMAGGLQSRADGRLRFGRLAAGPGYLRISDFGGSGWGEEIDGILAELDDTPGLILDLRSNGGGSDSNSEPILARFAREPFVYRHLQYRNGPEHDDFTELIEDRIEPDGHRYGAPVVVLINRVIFSTGDDFVLAMKTLGATLVGDTTGGGYGNPIARELPNGWTYRLSRWRLYDGDRVLLIDGVGIPPDHVVVFGDGDDGRDPILEKALEVLGETSPGTLP